MAAKGGRSSGSSGSGRKATPKSKPAISVEPRKGGEWAVQKDGTKRASKVEPRKQDAVDRARSQAKREKTELVIKGKDGKIQKKDSFGNDPPNVPG
jgi:hypothetical protein